MSDTLSMFSPSFAGLRAGDTVEFWRIEGLAFNAGPVKTRARVLAYLTFPDHVQVSYGPFGARVDSQNLIRIIRRAKR
jgi:hypothetical protein